MMLVYTQNNMARRKCPAFRTTGRDIPESRELSPGATSIAMLPRSAYVMIVTLGASIASAAALRAGAHAGARVASASRVLGRGPALLRRPIRLAATGAVEADEAAAAVDSAKPLASSFLRAMQSRGYLYQCSNIEALDELMSTTSVPVYLGFDATASSLHVGSLLQIMVLRKLQVRRSGARGAGAVCGRGGGRWGRGTASRRLLVGVAPRRARCGAARRCARARTPRADRS